MMRTARSMLTGCAAYIIDHECWRSRDIITQASFRQAPDHLHTRHCYASRNRNNNLNLTHFFEIGFFKYQT